MQTFRKTYKKIALLLAGTIFISSCASTTMIHSIPSGAKVYVDGEPSGITPYPHTDTKIVGSTTMVRLEKEGYEPFITSFSRNEQADIGAIIGGFLVLVPFLWTLKYKPERFYELNSITEKPIAGQVKTKSERLAELKQLYEDNLITKEEYDQERQKILAEK